VASGKERRFVAPDNAGEGLELLGDDVCGVGNFVFKIDSGGERVS
jgi:hypothetical protein